jgi:hypothetical protein
MIKSMIHYMRPPSGKCNWRLAGYPVKRECYFMPITNLRHRMSYNQWLPIRGMHIPVSRTSISRDRHPNNQNGNNRSENSSVLLPFWSIGTLFGLVRINERALLHNRRGHRNNMLKFVKNHDIMPDSIYEFQFIQILHYHILEVLSI